MGLLRKLRPGERGTDEPGGLPRFVNRAERDGNTYMFYSGTDPESAKEFLASQDVKQPQYYVVVETEDGIWGTDTEGLYLESIRPWQLDVDSTECEVSAARLQNMFGVAMAARGVTDNFISTLECGACGREWSDGVRYQDVTAVRCPGCGKRNSVDTRSLNVHLT